MMKLFLKALTGIVMLMSVSEDGKKLVKKLLTAMLFHNGWNKEEDAAVQIWAANIFYDLGVDKKELEANFGQYEDMEAFFNEIKELYPNREQHELVLDAAAPVPEPEAPAEAAPVVEEAPVTEEPAIVAEELKPEELKPEEKKDETQTEPVAQEAPAPESDGIARTETVEEEPPVAEPAAAPVTAEVKVEEPTPAAEPVVEPETVAAWRLTFFVTAQFLK